LFVPNQFDTTIQAAILALGVIAGAGIAIQSVRNGGDRRWSDNRRLAGVAAFTFLALLGYQVQTLARQAKEHADFVTCSTHLKQLGLALDEYVQDTGHYPPADRWDTAIAKYLPANEVADMFHCPDSAYQYGYAYNRAISNIPLTEVSNPCETVAVFECDSHTRNANGDQRDLVDGRHIDKPLYVFCDGSVRSVGPHYHDQYMTWKPKSDK
jgi:hypothetical protein